MTNGQLSYLRRATLFAAAAIGATLLIGTCAAWGGKAGFIFPLDGFADDTAQKVFWRIRVQRYRIPGS